MRWISQDRGRRAGSDQRLAERLSIRELVTGEVDLDPGRKAVPSMRHDAFATEVHVGRYELAAEEIVDNQRRDIAVAARRIVRRPTVVWIDSVRSPASSDRFFELNERIHGRRPYPTRGDVTDILSAKPKVASLGQRSGMSLDGSTARRQPHCE